MTEMVYHRCFCHYYERRFSHLCVCDNVCDKVSRANMAQTFFSKRISKDNETKKSNSASKPHGRPKSNTVAPTNKINIRYKCRVQSVLQQKVDYVFFQSYVILSQRTSRF